MGGMRRLRQAARGGKTARDNGPSGPFFNICCFIKVNNNLIHLMLFQVVKFELHSYNLQHNKGAYCKIDETQS